MLSHALRYAQLGYPVFPCAPNAKHPLTANGLKDATTDPERIARWWGDTPRANVAIHTAGLVVLDLDVLDDGTPNPWLADQPDRLRDLAPAVLSITPRGGRHYVFKAPEGRTFRNTAGKLAPKVDTRADGGYILTVPSQVAGNSYQWGSVGLDETPREALPEPPAWLVDLLDAASAPKRAPEPATNLVPLDLTKPGDDFCLRATWQEILEPHGWKYAGESLGSQRWTRPGKDDGVSATSGYCKSDSGRELFYCFTPNAPPLVAGESYSKFAAYATLNHAGDFGAAATELASRGYGSTSEAHPDDIEPSSKGPGAFPKHLLSVPGFMGRAMEFNLAGARKAQPILALGASLCLMSVLTGRKVTDPFGTRTNLYVLGVADSGAGKERARVVNKEVLFCANLDKRYAEGIASHAGLVNRMEAQPETLFQVDEIGRWLRTLSQPNVPAHLANLISVLMMLFTSSETVFVTDAYADLKIASKTIIQPHAVLYGTTVPDSLYQGFTAESVSDGFMSRLLVFESEDPDPDPRPSVRKMQPPDDLVQTAKFWGDFTPPGWGSLSDKKLPVPLVVEYTAEAERLFEDFERLARSERRQGGRKTATLWTRATEKARKCALLWACSENHLTPLVGYKAAAWACELVEFLTRKMLFIADEYVAETAFDANRKRLLRKIKEAGDAGLSATRLVRASQYLKNRERQEILDSLTAGGQVRTVTLESARRPKTVYVAQ